MFTFRQFQLLQEKNKTPFALPNPVITSIRKELAKTRNLSSYPTQTKPEVKSAAEVEPDSEAVEKESPLRKVKAKSVQHLPQSPADSAIKLFRSQLDQLEKAKAHQAALTHHIPLTAKTLKKKSQEF